MRFTYTYKSYPNCPKATAYSKSAEEATSIHTSFSGWALLFAIMFFLYSAFEFFTNGDWSNFLSAIAFLIAAALYGFYAFIVRPNNTECGIAVILTEESCQNPIANEVCEAIRKKNKQKNMASFKTFFPLMIASVCDLIALVAAISGVYLLYHNNGGLLLLLCSTILIGLFSYIIWRIWPRSNSKGSRDSISTKNKIQEESTVRDTRGNTLYCRKCGNKVLPDSVFCSHCGTKLV